MRPSDLRRLQDDRFDEDPTEPVALDVVVVVSTQAEEEEVPHEHCLICGTGIFSVPDEEWPQRTAADD